MMIYKKAQFLLTTVFLLLSLAGCGSVLSDLETKNNNKNDKQKSQCPISSAENCWARSIQLISQCLPSFFVGEMTSNRRFCQNPRGLIVNFLNPYDLNPTSKRIEFDVYNRERKCFRVHKQGDNLAITDTDFGDIRLEVLDSKTKTMSVSCLFGESIQINAKNLSENCTPQKVKSFQDWPEAVYSYKEDESARNFMFSFVGLGIGDAPVFNCKQRK